MYIERKSTMFTVKTPEEVFDILKSVFLSSNTFSKATETVDLAESYGRILAHDITAGEYVPGFTRSTVDGYAVLASDTFGCSDSIPAVLEVSGEVRMGSGAEDQLLPGCCMYVPTGGAVPEGADAMVMIEYTEDYGDGSIGILKSAAPGMNIIYKGDDVYPGKSVISAGRRLTGSDIGAMAAMGISKVSVRKRPVIGIISTGDELVPVTDTPEDGEIRDVNTVMLDVMCRSCGALTRLYGIIPDDRERLTRAVESAIDQCDIILISGGSSVGTKDITAQIIEENGEILLHGIAMKPGKPTILGKADGKPVFGLPGHPVAAFFVSHLFVRYLILSYGQTTAATETDCPDTGSAQADHKRYMQKTQSAELTEAVSANHGREEYMAVRLQYKDHDIKAVPVHTKSGLISSLAGTDGYIIIQRDCEGLAAGTAVDVYLF